MKNKKSTFDAGFLLGIIALLAISGVYVYESRRTEPPVSSPDQTLNPQGESDSLVSTAGWVTGNSMDYPADLIVTPAAQGSQQGTAYAFPPPYFSGSSIAGAKISSYSTCGSEVPTTNMVIENVSLYRSANGLVYNVPGACNNAFILAIATGTSTDADSPAYQNLKNIFYTMIDSMAKKLKVPASPAASSPAASSTGGIFSVSPITGAAPLAVQFTDTIGSAGDTSIDYGDGTSCTTANPDGTLHCSLYAHTYSAPGTYTAKLYGHHPTTLQAQLSISVTGSGTPSGVSVTGMAQYTDQDFGFSFWYPNTWAARDASDQKSYAILPVTGGTITKSLTVGPVGDLTNTVLIQEFVSSGLSITDSTPSGPGGNGSLSLTYSFDPATHTWMAHDIDGEGHPSTYAANVSANTMGGLHMLYGNARFGDDVIIPLSASHFLVVSSVDAGTIQEQLLAQTVAATDPSIATPTSTEQQIVTIRAEGLIYGAIGEAAGDWYVDSQHVYDHFGNIIATADPSAFRLLDAYSDGYVSPDTGYATDGTRVYSGWSNGSILLEADPATFVPIRQQYQIPYAPSSGNYGQSFTTYSTDFSKDKSHVWYEGRLIPGADPNTFVVTGETGVPNSTGGYTLAHDADHVYGVDPKNNITIDGAIVQQ